MMRFNKVDTDLPSAETLEEEKQCKSPDDSREQYTDQGQTLDPLTAPQLNTQIR